MINKQEIKLINSLNRKKNRIETGLFVVEGVKSVEELINSNYSIHKIYATDEWENNSGLDFIKISNKDLERISGLSNPNKVVALASMKETSEVITDCTSLIIDNVNDPGNLGTIIRTADWFGIKQIICSENSVDCYNPKVIMSTMGSIFRVNIVYTELVSFLKNNKTPVYGALLEGTSIFETRFNKTSFLLLGSEAHGISEDLIPFITEKITIPGSGTAESLNLGVSTGIIVSEYFRQHN